MRSGGPGRLSALGFVALLLPAAAASGCRPDREEAGAALEAALEDRAPSLKAQQRRQLADALSDAGARSKIDPLLLLAVVEEESRFDPLARSRKGAVGLMQLRPATALAVAARHDAAWRGPESLLEPALNVRIGAAYLSELYDRFGSWELALAAYHNGPSRIRRLQARGRRVPSGYSTRVLNRHRVLREAYAPEDDARPRLP